MIKDNRDFFKEKVFKILAKELWKRYYQKKDFGVSIGMKVFGEENTDPLRSLMGINPIDWSKMKRVSLAKFEAALKNSVFSWDINDFVGFVTKESLLVKEEVEAEEQRRYQLFCQSIEEIDPVFLTNLSEKQLNYWFHSGMEDLTAFRQVSRAVKNLPKEYMRMPVFAYQQTGDAHSFDEGKAAGQLFLQLLSSVSKTETSEIPLAQTEIKHQLLAEFYLLRDDIKNDVAVRGLESKNEGQINQMWQQACFEGCSWNVPLKEILRMGEIYPFNGDKVLVIENSGVYSILVDLLPTVPIVCSSGQFTYAVWQLLRKLEQNNTQIYYVGDLDPEGILMAQRLLEIFPDNGNTIGMNLDNYHLASKSSDVSQRRLKQLRVVKELSLKQLSERIIETGQVAYQEGFIHELVKEVEKVFNLP
ncbi:TIGR02679 domain-containing protein [Desemzia incerta]|uniref:TIGR02679 domain-containing protein n=1 Tax=Desemzia incerta TaxID=82801 RepID=UPI0016615427|nr:TIGR02679 domain-containing protein [Desemzia incerta]